MAVRISIALCTYNGEAFLPRQLESIAAQTRPPDELIVCDDASRDGTAALVDDFARRAGFTVRLLVNPVNLGYAANFNHAAELCTGDLIAFCDQDDVWLPQRLARAESVWRAYPSTAATFSDAALVDENLRPLGRGLWDAAMFTPDLRARFRAGDAIGVLVNRTVMTGTTMTFRADLRSWALPIPAGWVHDAWMALMAAATGEVRMIEEPLVLYRQHGAQQIGVRSRTLRGQIARAMEIDADLLDSLSRGWEAAGERLRRSPLPLRDAGMLVELSRKAGHLGRRAAVRRLPRRRRFVPVWREWRSGEHGRYGLGLRSALADWLL